jgi:hypothetical protein
LPLMARLPGLPFRSLSSIGAGFRPRVAMLCAFGRFDLASAQHKVARREHAALKKDG